MTDRATRDEMFKAALAARENAHAPYSGFKVGACLLSDDGRLFAACNVENMAYSQSQCAEASAVGVMIAAGAKGIRAALVVGDDESLCTPCGGCRQRLSEFAAPGFVMHVAGLEGVRASFTMEQLLPHAFEFHLKARGAAAADDG